LDAVANAHVRRVLVVSSMSAFAGTRQLYGQAKLAIEAITHASGGCAVRPGLVYGDQVGGMTAALRKLVRLPIVPVIAGDARLYTVHADDLTAAVVALAAAEVLPPGTVSVAHPGAVSIRDVMSTLAKQEGRSCRFVPVPWQLVYAVLRITELLRVRPPFRADSLLGLVRTAPEVVNSEAVTRLGVMLRPFALDTADQG
jgi:nucleoside-diphosphate-sugar epimerase